MEHDYWLARWREGRTGFHQPEGHPLLQAHLARLGPAAGRRVLVPLCGKSRDLRTLAEAGFDVVGVELSEQAAEAFFVEQSIPPTSREEQGFPCFSGGGVSIVVGDFFAAAPALGSFDLVYDRASLVALPPDLRARLADQLARSLPPGAPVLLITFEFEPHVADGPPFAIVPAEVHSLFAERFSVELLEARDEPLSNTMIQRGITAAREVAWELQRLG